MKLLKIIVALIFISLLVCPSSAISASDWSPFKKNKKNNTGQQSEQNKTPDSDDDDNEDEPEPERNGILEKADERLGGNPVYADDDNWLERISSISHDSLLTVWREQSMYNSFDNFFNEFINIDPNVYLASDIPDSVYEERLKNIVSAIPMPFNNEVKRFIVSYTSGNKATMAKILGRSQYYFPMIEAELDRAGLPVELRMLAAIESALIPEARSRAGATGLWQFMYETGKAYGLEVNSFVDDRSDPLLATRAACKYLKYLCNLYDGDWFMALAAYNCGPGNVKKALLKAGDSAKSFWDIYPYLPKETRNYVPSFIAATYAYAYHRQHNITPVAVTFPLATDTVMVSNRLLHFGQINSTIGTSMDVLRALNPQYKLDIVPALRKDYPLTLPLADVSRFLENENEIYARDSIYLAEYLNPANFDLAKMQSVPKVTVYKVKSGDTLSAIASRYNVTVKNLKKWNNLKSDKISIGQKIEIHN